MKYFIIFLVFILTTDVRAQFIPDEDPMKSPLGWQELQSNPNDKASWEKYMGKKWKDFTYKEAIQVKILKQRLRLRQLEEEKREDEVFAKSSPTEDEIIPKEENPSTETSVEASTVNSKPLTEAERYQQILKKESVQSFITQLDDVYREEPEDMEELFKEAYENFLIIEDYYADAFDQLGVKYTYYSEKYPRGGYSEMRWLDDQRKRLRTMKEEELNRLKKQFLEEQLRKNG
ncbi:MAG: hypothetical protein AAF740_04050 [Bacteroidota bacterium]